MKTYNEMRNEFEANRSKSNPGSLAYYREMYEKGKHQIVINFLKNGDSFIGKQGFTYNAAMSEFSFIDHSKDVEILDQQGAWAGTHYTHVYKADSSIVVAESTYYSLFN